MGEPARRKVLRGAGLVARSAAVVAVIYTWEWMNGSGVQDYADYGALLLLALVVLVWAVIDGIRHRFRDAVTGWALASLLLLTLWVAMGYVRGGGIGFSNAFTLVVPAGFLVIYVGIPAAIGATVGSAVRLVAAKFG